MSIYEREKTDAELLAEKANEEHEQTKTSNAVLFMALGILAVTVGYFTADESVVLMRIAAGVGAAFGFFAISGIVAILFSSLTGNLNGRKIIFVVTFLFLASATVITPIYRNKYMPKTGKYTPTPAPTTIYYPK